MKIGILTGGGDVPGLNPAIRAVTIRAIREGHEVIGLHRGWAGLVDIKRDDNADNSNNYMELSEPIVNKASRTGGTFLHTSHTNPAKMEPTEIPQHLEDKYNDEINDLTPEVLKNLDYLNIDYLVPMGGDRTLSYAVRLYKEGVNIVAIPETMDNDVPGTDYCIGYSTCVTRTIEMTHSLRTSAGSHERFLVIEVFGRNAGFTALMPAVAGAANRCVIPEYEFEIEKLARLLSEDRNNNPSRYSVLLVSEGASFKSEDEAREEYNVGTIGKLVGEKVKELSPKYNNKNQPVNVTFQKLGYLTRCGAPDAIDSEVPTVFGNIAMDLILKDISGRLVNLKNGRYGDTPIDVVTSAEKTVNIDKFYNTERLRPNYKDFQGKPFFVIAGR